MSESKPYKLMVTVHKNTTTIRVTLPAVLASQLNINGKDSVTWELRDQSLILRKARV